LKKLLAGITKNTTKDLPVTEIMKKLLLFIAIIAMNSCTIVPNRMFKTPSEYQFAKDSTDTFKKPYYIQVDDRIELHIFSNDGFKLVDVTGSTSLGQGATTDNISYIIDENGEVKLPVIGRFFMKGMSIKEAENKLQEQYSKYYKDPFVLIRVTSRKAFVFSSDGGKGIVIQLQNDHTSLFEALALAGGVTEYGKSYQIKIVRGDYKNPQIFKADISSVEALAHSELQIYPNDIIYIDSGYNLGKRLTSDVLPYLTFLTTILILTTYFTND
jgi:polysaccharide biosynthesis/export protein